MNEIREISSGWVWAKLGEVCKLKNGYAFKSSDYSKEGIPVIRISDINEGVVSVDESVKVIANQEYENYIISKDEILVAMSGATTGKFGIFRNNIIAYQNQRVGKFHILDKNALNNTFLLFLLYSLKRKILEDAYGGAQPNISSGKIEELEIPLPPLPEQHRIVAKIEELFSSLDKSIESLKTAQQQLKIYRQAVLKWAFEGKLTNEDVVEGKLPQGWERVALKTITTKAKKVKSKEKKATDEFLYIDIGGIDNSINKIVTHKRYKWKDAPSRAQQIVKFEDTLFSTVRTYLRNIALVDKLIYEDQICSSGFTVIRAKYDEIVPKYLFYYSTFEGFIQPLNELQTGSSYPAVRDDDVLNQYINMPTELEEQHAIIAEIESRLSICDKIEESIEHSLKQSEALRQSILKKAFEGKLVPQDPNDEPASVLLDRIRAEREKNKPQNPPRREARKIKTKKAKS